MSTVVGPERDAEGDEADEAKSRVTAAYPVPFSFSSSCATPGTGSLTADYTKVTLKSGANPGCDYFVQFTGGTTAVKFTYWD